MKTLWKYVFLVLAIIPLIILGLFEYVQRLETSHQQMLLDTIKTLGEQKIEWGEMSSVNRTTGTVQRKKFQQHEIAFIQNLMKKADLAPIGGHNRSMYECSLTFTLEGDHSVHFSGIVFSEYPWNQGALYLYRDRDSEPVRIKYLGKWLIENRRGIWLLPERPPR